MKCAQRRVDHLDGLSVFVSESIEQVIDRSAWRARFSVGRDMRQFPHQFIERQARIIVLKEVEGKSHFVAEERSWIGCMYHEAVGGQQIVRLTPHHRVSQVDLHIEMMPLSKSLVSDC
jgi:hypothetical protein